MWRRRKSDRGAAPGGAAPAAPEHDLAPLGPEFTNRIDAILGDVREEADRILDDARRKAEGTTTDIDEALAYRRRRLLELYETLIARAELVIARLDDVELGRESLGRMMRAVSQAADELSGELDAPASRDRPTYERSGAAGPGAAARPGSPRRSPPDRPS
jgi:hypothetical protein